MPRYEFKYPSVITSEEKMMTDLVEILNENQIVGYLRHNFKIAVSEAFTNALLHGNRLSEDKLIIVSIDIKENSISADIIDQGQGGLGNIRNKKPTTLVAECGRGIDLITYYSTGVNFEELPTGGLKVSIEFDRKESKTIS